MTEQEIHEGSSLIENYMGRIYNPPLQYEHQITFNYLIEVVEKIEEGNYGFKMCRKVVEIYFDDTKELILMIKEKSRIQSLFKAVVEFIKWHNEQNGGSGK